jgi:phosphoketolase
VEVSKPGGTMAEATRVLGTWLRDVIKANPSSFRLMGPDETSSSRLDAVFDWQWLNMDDAIIHCTRGAGIWEWASNDSPGAPDVVMACCGDVPTLETLAAVSLLRSHLPDLKVRVVNVVDLMRLEPESEHPHGMSDPEFDALFTVDRPTPVRRARTRPRSPTGAGRTDAVCCAKVTCRRRPAGDDGRHGNFRRRRRRAGRAGAHAVPA